VLTRVRLRPKAKSFTISEVAADWHELMIPRRIMLPCTVRTSEQLEPRCSIHTDIPPPQSATLGLHILARKLLSFLISLRAESRDMRSFEIRFDSNVMGRFEHFRIGRECSNRPCLPITRRGQTTQTINGA